MTTDDGSNEWKRILGRLETAVKGEFEIVHRIGSGGMAAVYLAREIALNRRVAIKIMSPALLTGPGMIARFKREANTIAALDHPNIITIHRVGDVDDLHFLVMKFVEGRSLEQIIQDAGPLPIPVARGLLYMVGNALGHAHQRQVVHRDVKPANILIDGEGNAVVTDFGIAKALGTERSADSEIMGTAAYMSPEQCYDQPVTAATDQYSLGVVAYQMITGVLPFRGSLLQVMEGHAKRTAAPIRSLRGDCPPELEAGIMRMLAKEPSKRWPSLKQALVELGAAPLFPDHPARLALAKLGRPDGKRQTTELPPQPVVSSLTIPSPPAWIEAGDQLILRASAKDWAGDTMPGIAIRWQTDNPIVAAVDEKTGVVHGLAAGSATITATFEQLQCSAVLQVFPARVATITVSVPPGPIHVGDPPVRLVPRLEGKAHQELKRPVAWVTDDSRIAAVSDTGSLRGVGPGSTRVHAEAEGVRGTAEIQVAPARVVAIRPTTAPTSLVVGSEVALGAMPLDARGFELRDRTVTWLSSDLGVATITPEGVVTARGPGHVTFSCLCEGMLAFVELDVEAPTLILASPPIEFSSESLADETPLIQLHEPDFSGDRIDEAGIEVARASDPSTTTLDNLFGESGENVWTETVPETEVGAEPEVVATFEEPKAAESAEPAAATVASERPKRESWWRQRRAMVVGGGLALVLILAVVARAWEQKQTREAALKEQQRQDSIARVRAIAAADSARRDSLARIPASIAFATPPDTLWVGGDTKLDAVALNSANNPLPDSVYWRSRDTVLATVDSVSGVVKAKRAGNAEFVAVVGQLERPLTITIVGKPSTTTGNGGAAVRKGKSTLDAVGETDSGPCQSLGKEIGSEFNRMMASVKERRFADFQTNLQSRFAKELEDSIRLVSPKVVLRIHCRQLVRDGTSAEVSFLFEVDAQEGASQRPLLGPAMLQATLSQTKNGQRLTGVRRTQP